MSFVRCDRYHGYASGVIDYEVYNATTDLGQFEQTWYGSCLDYDSGFTGTPTIRRVRQRPNLP